MVRLTVVQGPEGGQIFTFHDGSVGVGSAADNEVRLADPFISRHHGRFSLVAGRCTYQDLGSTNGSTVERAGQQMILDSAHPQIELESGDLLLLGETIVRFEFAEAEQTVAPTPQHTLIASRNLEDLPASAERQLANFEDLLAAYELERRLSLAFRPEEMLDTILEATLKAFPAATHAILLLIDKQTGKPRRQVARVRGEAGPAKEEIPVSMSVANRVLREGKSLLFRDVASEFADSRSVVAAGIRSSLCVPLWTGEETVGLIQVESRIGRAAFTERDLDRLCLFANRAALAILASELCESEHKNQLLRDLSAMITHDLKGPLTTVMGFLDLLAREPLEEHQKEYVQIALADSQCLSVLIAGILDAAKIESGEMKLRREPTEVREKIEEALGLIAYQLREKEILLETAISPDLPRVPTDPELFRRVVLNLVGNAVKFSPQGGRLAVEATLDSRSHSVVVSMQDEGPGIPKEYQSRIFDKFVQVGTGKPAEKISVGLGLAFCKLAVEAHGGEIWVESEPGHGARFSFSLPLAAPASP